MKGTSTVHLWSLAKHIHISFIYSSFQFIFWNFFRIKCLGLVFLFLWLWRLNIFYALKLLYLTGFNNRLKFFSFNWHILYYEISKPIFSLLFNIIILSYNCWFFRRWCFLFFLPRFGLWCNIFLLHCLFHHIDSLSFFRRNELLVKIDLASRLMIFWVYWWIFMEYLKRT